MSLLSFYMYCSLGILEYDPKNFATVLLHEQVVFIL